MKKRRMTITALALIASLGVSSAPVFADKGGNGNGGNGHGNSGNHGNKGYDGKHGNGNGNGNGNGKGVSDEHGSKGKRGNSADDHGLVRVDLSYDRARSLALNYGLTGYQSLPPGIAKNLARGKPLPPGIAKKTVPASLLGQLPHYPGYEWRVVGDDLVLIALSTALVASVINGVFD
ncbi:anti-virulence regulator CigR family protein [Serratia rhizosphaerae]|uniref:anti-virulence regulator CigR family protein n=1 Tax=Serratia rhizosphaerae TaxID=2597702 RepID=UPI002DBFF35B|nr:anti-virulence regulator CigR family protein [Serratia rhizosphaerae]MEB6335525.1 anti-virulence regulator CigR family protein [Serratia rhizosphaerae]